MLFWLVALLAWNSFLVAEGIPPCEDALPPGFRFGGSIHLVTDCVWTPRVHFVTAISGRLPDRTGPLRAPTILLGSDETSSTSTGPTVVTGVVFQNFTLYHPTANQGPVLWPVGLLQPGVQQGTNLPLRLLMQDVEILVDADTLQQYISFFRSQDTLVYTDNATFLYIPWWSDAQTLAQGVGLLLDVPGLTALQLAGKTPAAGRNFVTAADNSTLVPLLTSVAGISTAVPFLVYLAANVSLGSNLSAAIPINRPVYFVGKVSEDTGIDFGMRVNQVVMLSLWSGVTFNRVSLENLGPGDQRSLQYSERFDVLMGYHIWPLLYYRSTQRATLHNCTLVLSAWEVEEYLYKATLFKVQPAGFQHQLEVINSQVQEWQVDWLYDLGIVQTVIRRSTAMLFVDTNLTSAPVAAARLRLPARFNDTSLRTVPGNALEHSITHVSEDGVSDIGLGAGLPPARGEMMLLTVNMSFGVDLPTNSFSVEANLTNHLKQHIQEDPGMKHAMMGIVVPSVTLNMGYTTDFVTLPPDAPPRYLTLVNLALLQLSQGPGALLPGANMQTPDIYTHLLWSISRNHQVASVWLSNVTLWLPASEFSYIRSFVVKEGRNTFRIDLAGGQFLYFTGVVDRQAEGLYVQHYVGPGMEADSLNLKLEAGWNQDGPPRGFWGLPTGATSGRLSETLIIVLAVCSVTVIVASILGLLALVLWRRRVMEARAAAVLSELGKGATEDGSRGDTKSDRSSAEHSGSGSKMASHYSYAAQAAGRSVNAQLACAILDAPVHDSSDSYLLHERAQLTADLARSQLGARQQCMRQPAGDDNGATAGRRVEAATSEAAFHRLHSAITILSQDVLSRRLQVSSNQGLMGQMSGPVSNGAGPPLGGPSLLRVVEAGGDAGNDPQASGIAATADSRPASLARASAVSMHSEPQQQHEAVADRAAAAAGTGQDAKLSAAGDPGGPAESAAGRMKPRSTAVATASGGNVTAVGSCMSDVKGLGELKLLQLVGQGTFGQVYKALWRRRCVAVKVLQLPATAGGSDAAAPWMGVGRVSSHREKMAVMETVVSTTMSHPNIVQVYTYVLQPLLSGQGGSVQSSSSRLKGNVDQGQQQPEDQQLLQQEQQQLQQISGQLKQQEQQELPIEGQDDTLAAAVKQQEQLLQQPAQAPVNVQAAGQIQGNAERAKAIVDATVNDQLVGSGVQDAKKQLSVDSSPSSSTNKDLEQPHHPGEGDIVRLSPEMAAAAAAALPGAAAAAASSNDNSVVADHGGGEGNSVGHSLTVVGWELRLVMEFCDAGSLRAALDHKLLIDRTTGLPALECVLFLAHDVACAMIHLHSEHLLHGDLKASNVLLKRTAPRLPVPSEQLTPGVGGGKAGQLMGFGLGLMAKVADFGLSLTLGPADTHVSQMHMGTLTHMAPELLLHGRASKSSDVYAYGILLWELATGRRPYSGTPVGMLAHKVAQQGWRPAWPGGCSLPVQLLAEACWAQDAAVRPTFEQIVQQLEDMAGQLEQLKQQQAQDMAAAAAPVYHHSTSHHELGDPGHELTPSLLKDLMPSGFSAGSEHSGEEVQIADSGGVYEMSCLSSSSQDRPVLDSPQGILQLQDEWCISGSA